MQLCVVLLLLTVLLTSGEHVQGNAAPVGGVQAPGIVATSDNEGDGSPSSINYLKVRL